MDGFLVDFSHQYNVLKITSFYHAGWHIAKRDFNTLSCQLIWFCIRLKVTFSVYQDFKWDQDINLISISTILELIYDNETLGQNENQGSHDSYVGVSFLTLPYHSPPHLYKDMSKFYQPRKASPYSFRLFLGDWK